MNNHRQKLPAVKLWWMLACIALAALATLVCGSMLGGIVRQLRAGYMWAVPEMIIAAGVALTYAAGGLDLSFFGVSALCAGSIYYCSRGPIGDGASAAVTLLVGLVVGAINGLCARLIGKMKRRLCALVSLVVGAAAYAGVVRLLFHLPNSLGFKTLQTGALNIFITDGTFMMTPLLALLICALFCFAPGGNRLFARRSEQDRQEQAPAGVLLAYCASGFLTAFAMVILSFQGHTFSFLPYQNMITMRYIPEVLVILAVAAIGVPNFRESKGEAFAGLLSVFFGGIFVNVVVDFLGIQTPMIFHRIFEAIAFGIFGVAGGIVAWKLIQREEAAAASDAGAAGGNSAQPVQVDGVIDALERLRDQGVLSEEEYQQKRANLTPPR